MEVINIIDGRGRLVRVDFYNKGFNLQRDSHTVFYLWVRENMGGALEKGFTPKDYYCFNGCNQMVPFLKITHRNSKDKEGLTGTYACSNCGITTTKRDGWLMASAHLEE
jgi:hypothetical protein